MCQELGTTKSIILYAHDIKEKASKIRYGAIQFFNQPLQQILGGEAFLCCHSLPHIVKNHLPLHFEYIIQRKKKYCTATWFTGNLIQLHRQSFLLLFQCWHRRRNDLWSFCNTKWFLFLYNYIGVWNTAEYARRKQQHQHLNPL